MDFRKLPAPQQWVGSRWTIVFSEVTQIEPGWTTLPRFGSTLKPVWWFVVRFEVPNQTAYIALSLVFKRSHWNLCQLYSVAELHRANIHSCSFEMITWMRQVFLFLVPNNLQRQRKLAPRYLQKFFESIMPAQNRITTDKIQELLRRLPSNFNHRVVMAIWKKNLIICKPLFHR